MVYYKLFYFCFLHKIDKSFCLDIVAYYEEQKLEIFGLVGHINLKLIK